MWRVARRRFVDEIIPSKIKNPLGICSILNDCPRGSLDHPKFENQSKTTRNLSETVPHASRRQPPADADPMQTLKPSRPPAAASALFLWIGLLSSFSFSTVHSQASADAVGTLRTQAIDLEAGWNAVYLEIEPLETNPSALFAGTPIEILASHFRPSTPMEFIDNPAELIGERKSWSVWYAPERDDALLSDLYSVRAHRGYLIYSNETFTWNVVGSPYFGAVEWYANSHCLVGFQSDPINAPTLASFFSGARAHTPLRIYQMVEGRWERVTDPASTLMESGEAYWVYCEGASDFAGPFQIDFAGASSGGLIFNENSQQRRIEVTNVADYPQDFALTLQPGANGRIPLAYVVRGLNASERVLDDINVPFPETLTITSIEPGESFGLDITILGGQVNAATLGSNLVVTSDAGMRADVPILSIRKDLLE